MAGFVPRRSLVALTVALLVFAGCAQLMATSIEALIKQGLELLAAQKWDEAIGKFLEVVRRDPKYWEAYLHLARGYIGKGAWTDAIASGRKALELAPTTSDVIPALAQAVFGAGTDALARRQFSDAAGHFTEFLKLRPTDWQGYLQLGRAWLGAGNYADALAALAQGAGHATEGGAREQLAAAFADLGKAYWQSGQLGNALGAFQRVLELDPNHADALQFLRGRR